MVFGLISADLELKSIALELIINMSIHIYTIYYTILAYKLIAFGSISPGLDLKSVQLGLVVNMTIYIYTRTFK